MRVKVRLRARVRLGRVRGPDGVLRAANREAAAMQPEHQRQQLLGTFLLGSFLGRTRSAAGGRRRAVHVDQERAAVGPGDLDDRGAPAGEELIVTLELRRIYLVAQRDDPSGPVRLTHADDALHRHQERNQELADPVEERDLGVPPQRRRAAVRAAQPRCDEPDLHRGVGGDGDTS